MCTSKPKAPKPVPNAPVALPTSVDDAAITASREEQLRARMRRGRSSTVLAGALGSGTTSSTGQVPVKTALGA